MTQIAGAWTAFRKDMPILIDEAYHHFGTSGRDQDSPPSSTKRVV
jgi:hypothetical protein